MTKAVGRSPVNPRARDPRETDGVLPNWADPARTMVFFGLGFAYLWLWVKPALIASCGTVTNFPVFYKGWPFFFETVRTPGGFLQYVSAFASQMFYFSWAGAAVITLHAWTLSACTGYLLRKAGLPGARLLRFVPAIFMLVAYARYSYHLPLFVGALASAAFASLYVQSVARARSPLGVFFGLFGILYLAGAAAVLPFAALCATYELRDRRWRRAGLYALVAAFLPYVLGVLVFRISLDNAYTELLPVSWRVLGWPTRQTMIVAAYVAYLFPIAGVLAAGVWDLAKSRLAARRFARGTVVWALGTLALFSIGGAAAWLLLDTGQRALLEVHHYACRRQWPEVLVAAYRCPAETHAVNAINRALYHDGRLGRDLFLYAQPDEALLITGDDHIVQYWHAFDTLIDLGLMNQAEKNLTECLETFGEQPLILERLAMVNLVKGRTEAARIYLGTLRRTLFHHRWASEQMARLDADPSLSSDVEIQRLRLGYFRPGSPAEFYDRETLLTALIGPETEQGVRNRMAFEYLMAWNLLKGNLGRIVQQLDRLDEFGYMEIPPLWQEAILIYAYGTGKTDILKALAIHPEIERRFKNFSAVVNRHGVDRVAAIRELARDYRGSFFFYYFCTKVANR
ncbi:MAG TPA: DUF6057 family protein [Sedimentisphaerales bacterium]|nr:DUF6057 family protein [Sedimentisphaerales bacterium]